MPHSLPFPPPFFPPSLPSLPPFFPSLHSHSPSLPFPSFFSFALAVPPSRNPARPRFARTARMRMRRDEAGRDGTRCGGCVQEDSARSMQAVRFVDKESARELDLRVVRCRVMLAARNSRPRRTRCTRIVCDATHPPTVARVTLPPLRCPRHSSPPHPARRVPARRACDSRDYISD
ncbi:hypothetical protein DFH06DRAFT_1344449 [Mycena polygramma]|nr:hypothetical protein DFH06DRAFT_1344449 [Mycena polygramma]